MRTRKQMRRRNAVLASAQAAFSIAGFTLLTGGFGMGLIVPMILVACKGMYDEENARDEEFKKQHGVYGLDLS